jgi:hypothetical protein
VPADDDKPARGPAADEGVRPTVQITGFRKLSGIEASSCRIGTPAEILYTVGSEMKRDP